MTAYCWLVFNGDDYLAERRDSPSLWTRVRLRAAEFERREDAQLAAADAVLKDPSLLGRVRTSRGRKVMVCKKPDVDVPKLVCGHPLPCPRHTVVVEMS